MLFSKNGSIPKPETDNTEGWVEVPDKPDVPEGKEVAWLNGEWVVRDPRPEDRPGYQWNWAHELRSWVECEYPTTGPEVIEPPVITEPTVSASISSGYSATIGGGL
jgi:hypothetical protein